MRNLASVDAVAWRRRPFGKLRAGSRPPNELDKIAQAGNLCRLFILSALLAAVLTLQASAQRSSTPASATRTSHAGRPNANSARARNHQPSASRRASTYAPYASLPFPFFGDNFDPNDIYSTGYPVASDTPPFLLQAMRSMAGPAAGSMEPGASPFANHQSSSSQPLMIELQHGHYVRANGSPANGEALRLSPAPVVASPRHDQPSAVLIFRDGHSEEVHDYAIADGILYARGDYYTDGYWNKKIALSALNVAETFEANASRKVKFVLPASPNEVITRP